MYEFDINKIKEIVQKKYKWGPSIEWTNYHFIELSRIIFENTGERISEETLKRIFGKRKPSSENYHPQAYTQIVLKKFYNSLSGSEVEMAPKKKNLQIAALVLLILLSIPLLFYIFIKPESSRPVMFTCDNPVDLAPYTATFRYGISMIKDSVFINPGNNTEIYLPPEIDRINYFYKSPGVYKVSLFTRSRIINELSVFAYSPDWIGGYFPNEFPEKFKPFHNQNIFKEKEFFFASSLVLKNEGVNLTERFWTSYKYIMPFERSLDSLTFETRVLNNESTGSLFCYDIGVEIIGETGRVSIKFTQPRCSRHSRIYISEKKLDGQFNDLSSLAIDLSDWVLIKMVTSNKTFNLYVDNKLIMKQKYEQALGNLFGIVYNFFGTGKIDHLILKDSKSQVFYENLFQTQQ